MLYLLPGSSSMVGIPQCFGAIINPHAYFYVRKPVIEGRWWASDNGAFSNKFSLERLLSWLELHRAYQSTCLFAVVPDVVSDWFSTCLMFEQLAPQLQEMGYPLAFVAQDGQVPHLVPWGQIRCLFIGGSTEWKLSQPVVELIQLARQRRIWVHVGRVNSVKRILWCRKHGVSSVDGTYPRFAGMPATIQRFTPALQGGPYAMQTTVPVAVCPAFRKDGSPCARPATATGFCPTHTPRVPQPVAKTPEGEPLFRRNATAYLSNWCIPQCKEIVRALGQMTARPRGEQLEGGPEYPTFDAAAKDFREQATDLQKGLETWLTALSAKQVKEPKKR